MKRIYVVGFAFSADKKQVVVISKTNPKNTLYEDRPVWLANKYNGIGTDLKEGELPEEGMVRTFNERAGVVTPQEIWKSFAEIQNPYATVIFYKAMLPKKQWEAVTSKTNEQVMKCHMSQLHNYTMVSNLSWLLPMALDPLHNYSLTVDDKAEPVRNYTPLILSRYHGKFDSTYDTPIDTNIPENFIMSITETHVELLELVQDCADKFGLLRSDVLYLMEEGKDTITKHGNCKEAWDIFSDFITKYIAEITPTIKQSSITDKVEVKDKLVYAVFDGNNAGESITITGNGLTATGDAKVAPAGAAEKIAEGVSKNKITIEDAAELLILTGQYTEDEVKETLAEIKAKQGQDPAKEDVHTSTEKG